MRYLDEFRDPKVAEILVQRIISTLVPHQDYKIMEFCGGHTHVVHRYGFKEILPPQIDLIHGPGCPVCILPISRIDQAIALATQQNVILCSYADMMRVPGSQQQSLLTAKARGADVRMVYSVEDALAIARSQPSREVVFFAIGFETTTPPTAVAILQARQEQLTNFTVFCNHVLTPVAMSALLTTTADSAAPVIDGFIGPAHVSLIIGSDAYRSVAHHFKKPIVIAGFEPIDLLQALNMLIEMINQRQFGVKNQFTRAVSTTGNVKAQQKIKEVFTIRDRFEWRGLGWITKSAIKIRSQFAAFDAEERFTLPTGAGQEHRACQCAAVLRGQKKPIECALFATACTPSNPLGACMVSSEGACAASYAFDRARILIQQRKLPSHDES